MDVQNDDEHTQGDGRKAKWKMRRKETENKNGVVAPERPPCWLGGWLDGWVDGMCTWLLRLVPVPS
jgi:hypothetical protein